MPAELLDPLPPDAAHAGPGPDTASGGRPDALVRTRFWLLCALLGALALLLRLPTLSSRSLWLDETYSAWFAATPLHELWTHVPLYETHPPFYYTLLKGWIALFGRSEAAMRSLSVLASVLTVILIPLGARAARLGGRAQAVALLAGLFLACNAQSILFAQQARPYALQALAGGLAVGCAGMLLRALARPRAAHAPAHARAWPWALGLAFCAGLTLWLHNTGVFAAFGIWTGLVLACLAGGLAVPGGRRRQALAVGAAGAGALLVWSPFLPMLVKQSAAMDHLAYWIRFSPRDMKAAWTVMCGGQALHYPVALLVLLAFAWLWQRARPQFWLLACVLALPIAALGAYSYLVKPLFLSRLFEWLAAPTMVLLALGVFALRPRWRGPSVAMLLALSAWSVLGFYRSQTENWREMLAELSHDSRPGDLVLALPNEVQMAVAYYMPTRAGRAVMYLPAPFPALGLARRYVANPGAPGIAPDDITRLRAQLASHRRVWLIERRADLYDPDGLVPGELERRYRLARRIDGNGATIRLYEDGGGATPAAPAPARAPAGR